MYESFYGFSEKPFEVLPDPKFLFLASSHLEALGAIASGIRERKGPIVVTGEVGTGKTTLVRYLLEKLDEKVKTAFIFHTTISLEELLKNILMDLGLPVGGEEKTDLWNQLIAYANQLYLRGENLAIIIDEAQNLGEEVLEEFLEKVTQWGSRQIQLVLIGQPELERKLGSQALARFEMKIRVRSRLSPFSEDDCKKYIDHRLRLAGGLVTRVFTPKALSLICRNAQGIPRTINILCDHALLTGYALSKEAIDADIVRQVVRNLDGKTRKTDRFEFLFSFRAVSLAILALFFLGSLTLLADRYFDRRSGKMAKGPAALTSIPLLDRTYQPSPPPSAKARETEKETTTVKGGDTLSDLALRHYGLVHPTLIDLILDSNPEITDANFIRVGQVIHLPRITEETFILQSSDSMYQIFLGTFGLRDSSRLQIDESLLGGKEIAMVPRKVSPEDTWYRVLIGKFTTKEEALETLNSLRKKGLVPRFEKSPKRG